MKIKLKLPHFHVSDTCVDATVATAARAPTGRVSMSTRSRKIGCGADSHRETPSSPGSVGVIIRGPHTKGRKPCCDPRATFWGGGIYAQIYAKCTS